MSDKSRVIEKVKKLLALAGSANQHEAELAAMKAQGLMTVHQLTAKDVSDDPTEIVPGAIFVRNERPELWSEILVTQVGALNGCASFVSKTDIGFGLGVVGRPDDIAAARVLCRYLAAKVVEAVKEYLDEDGRRGIVAAQSFAVGVVEGVVEKLEKARGDAARVTVGDVSALLVVDNRVKRAREYLEDSGAGDAQDKKVEMSTVARVLGRMKGYAMELQKAIE